MWGIWGFLIIWAWGNEQCPWQSFPQGNKELLTSFQLLTTRSSESPHWGLVLPFPILLLLYPATCLGSAHTPGFNPGVGLYNHLSSEPAPQCWEYTQAAQTWLTINTQGLYCLQKNNLELSYFLILKYIPKWWQYRVLGYITRHVDQQTIIKTLETVEPRPLNRKEQSSANGTKVVGKTMKLYPLYSTQTWTQNG